MGMIRDAIEAKGLTVNAVSRITDVSEMLIRMLDAGHVTQPNIARRIAQALDLTPEQEQSLIPEERRGKPLPEPVMLGVEPKDIIYKERLHESDHIYASDCGSE